MADKKAAKAPVKVPPCTLRTRKCMVNPLLNRKQMMIEIVHPLGACPSKPELRKKLQKLYKVKDAECVVLYGFRTQFGGGRTRGFAFVYDTVAVMKKLEPKFRLVRAGLLKKVETNRKQRKERKNRTKKVRGTRKSKVAASGKKK
eukprot:TRINITY_DN306_c0_g1_i1.p1 TRINITY_DN306_c0_g1~~TRINITY_DN306_c0_g1_i1.p1  ORF type:complete len:145 (-),score=70.01 TRINITY_DN306_c0_g1_i1:188-622(-)